MNNTNSELLKDSHFSIASQTFHFEWRIHNHILFIHFGLHNKINNIQPNHSYSYIFFFVFFGLLFHCFFNISVDPELLTSFARRSRGISLFWGFSFGKNSPKGQLFRGKILPLLSCPQLGDTNTPFGGAGLTHIYLCLI